MPEDFRSVVRRLANERDLSVAQVSYDAYDRSVKGTNPDTFKSVMAGRRRVTPALMEAVARALDVSPDVFYEYRLAKAREALDEAGPGGPEAALGMLAAIEAALNKSATKRRRPGAPPSE